MRAICALAIILVAAIPNSSQGQVDPSGQTSLRELSQIRRLAEKYWPDDLADRTEINWNLSEVWRVDLDDDGEKEAVFTYEGSTICGASTCRMLIVKWFASSPRIVAVLGDGPLQVLTHKTNGWHDLLGHYHLYRWNGSSYDRLCLPDSDCYKG